MSRSQEANDRMRLRTYLRNCSGHATVDDARYACTRDGERLWSKARITRAIDWDRKHPDNRALIKFVKGGRGLRLVENDERVGLGRGAKAEVVRAISSESAKTLRLFGTLSKDAKHLRVIETGKRAGPEYGTNTRPDIVVGAKISLKSRRPLLHNIEFQGKNTSGISTFTTSDIAQAFTCGRGADFSWVMIHKSARKFKKDRDYVQWERTLWFAEWIGVGIITYSDPALVSTWNLVLNSKKRARIPSHSNRYIRWFMRLIDEDKYPI